MNINVAILTKQQLKAISELTHMDIDIAFKRINGNTNEWEISAYLPRVQKSRLKFLNYIFFSFLKKKLLIKLFI